MNTRTFRTTASALAAALPEFAPYATMTREDIDECGKDKGVDPAPAVLT